jgi:hypothetical protein
MLNALRILVPVGLFLAFAGAHYMAMRSPLPFVELAAAATDLPAGHRLTVDDLRPTTVQGPVELFRTFVPFGQRGKDLLHSPLNRNLKRGELVTLTDLMQVSGSGLQLQPDEVGVHVALERLSFADGQLTVGIHVGFLLERNTAPDIGKMELLEPFRVVGIGDRVTMNRGANQDQGNQRVLTIAVKRAADGTLDERATRVMRAAEDRIDRDERIRALVMLGAR